MGAQPLCADANGSLHRLYTGLSSRRARHGARGLIITLGYWLGQGRPETPPSFRSTLDQSYNVSRDYIFLSAGENERGIDKEGERQACR